jgi:hypothetical protein
MKSSFHSRALGTQLTRCRLFSIIFDCRLKETPSIIIQLAWHPRYIASGQPHRKTPFPNNPFIDAYVFVAAGTCLLRRCIAMNFYSGSAISAFRRRNNNNNNNNNNNSILNRLIAWRPMLI